ncbi:hypothetical protein BDA96_09G098500 [Sorghum bicolor]|nr:hypothetical protein BDA96_09G098500 [Sorghum bicolor]
MLSRPPHWATSSGRSPRRRHLTTRGLGARTLAIGIPKPWPPARAPLVLGSDDNYDANAKAGWSSPCSCFRTTVPNPHPVQLPSDGAGASLEACSSERC